MPRAAALPPAQVRGEALEGQGIRANHHAHPLQPAAPTMNASNTSGGGRATNRRRRNARGQGRRQPKARVRESALARHLPALQSPRPSRPPRGPRISKINSGATHKNNRGRTTSPRLRLDRHTMAASCRKDPPEMRRHCTMGALRTTAARCVFTPPLPSRFGQLSRLAARVLAF